MTDDKLPISSVWLSSAAALRTTFEAAEPFPVLVLDDFLDEQFAEKLLEEFPPADRMPKSRDYVFGEKRELSSVADQGPASRAFQEAMLSDRFRDFLSQATGFQDLFVDPDSHGGGFHQGLDGGFLDTHVDFNVHPLHDDWLRTLNILVYLNKDWKEEWAGELLIRSSLDTAPRAIAPLFNRAVIMLTGDATYHGYLKLSLPAGVSRKSVATYAYRPIPRGSVTARTTGWAPENAGFGKRVLAQNYNALVMIKNRFFGSSTARNR